jgi:1-deoxy-D-xylulose-5-phosphate reductoisomerase
LYRTLTLLGSTGSIGRQTLDVARRLRDGIRVVGLAAGRNVALLAEQVREFSPEWVHVGDPALLPEAREALGAWRGRLLAGDEGLEEIAAQAPAELVLVATVGFTGLAPTIAALKAGRDIALANKEVLVCAGHLVMGLARERGRRILPVDSEHNAIFQCLQAGPGQPLRRIVLTCSGGSLRHATQEEIDSAPAARTLRHPTWTMGSKITVDSATLMNKGLEVIEAHHLFGIDADRIEVVIHPQSVIHSMVEFVDGSMIAQLGVTDMRLPIQNVLTFPARVATDLAPLDLLKVGRLDFSEPDLGRFPCLAMAYEALRADGTAPCALNAANEVAVAAHLAGEIPCGGIPGTIRAVMDRHANRAAADLDTLRAVDAEARALAREHLDARSAAAR